MVLALTWAGVVHAARTGAVSARQVWALGSVWSLPFLIGPPILSNDVYSYVAQGAVSASGADPSTATPFSLGWASPLLHAVDPRWRSTVSPYGPAATALERSSFELAPGHPVVAVVIWRLVAAVSVAVTGAVAMSFVVGEDADDIGRRRAVVAALTVANPLLLLHVVAAGHLDGVMVCLVVVALRVAAVPGRSAVLGATVLATTAAAIKAPAALIVALVAVVAFRSVDRAGGAGRTGRAGWAVVGSVTVVAAATWGGWTALAGSGLHLLAVVRTPSLGRTLAAPSTLIADLLSPLLGADAGAGSTLLTVTRALTAVAGLGLVAGLLATADRRPPTSTAAAALLTTALASPVLYPWYLTWSVPLLAIRARGRDVQRLTLLCGLGAIMTIQGLTRLGTEVTATLVVAASLIWAVRQENVDQRLALLVNRYLAARTLLLRRRAAGSARDSGTERATDRARL